MILAASAFSPLRTWANAGENPNLLTLAFAFAVIAAFGVAVWQLLRWVGLDSSGANYATAVFVLSVTNTGVLVDRYPFGQLIFVAASGVLAAFVYRLRDVGLMRVLLAWAAFVAIAFPMITIFERSGGGNDLRVEAEADLVVSSLISTPDIVVVVLDAYGSTDVLEQFYGYDNATFLTELEQQGFAAEGVALANYARTTLSVPSVLQLGYVAEETPVSRSDIDALLRVMSGESNLVHALRDHGYRHVYVEPGWLGARCGTMVDICVGAPWPDETFYDVAYRSALRGIPGLEVGRSFTEGVLRGLDWLHSDLATYLVDDQPDLVYVHLLAPHPPLFLDEQCRPDWRGGVTGFAIGRPEMSEDELAVARDRYIDQVECVNSVLLRAAEKLGADDVVLMFGDHGPDSTGQLFRAGTEWSEEQRRERFGSFYAARVPGCDMSEIGSLVNLGRRMLSCLSGDELPDLPTFIYDMQRSPEGSRITQLELPKG
ncbi:MAG: sulfatase-like hydrolase/transferase [Acidimicrobiia bacterium]